MQKAPGAVISTRQYVLDAHSGVRALVDPDSAGANQALTDRYRYDAYGQLVWQQSPLGISSG